MARPRGRTKTARLTVNLEPQEYASLQALARQADVPLAWLIRRAVTELLATNAPAAPQSVPPLGLPSSLTPRVLR